MWGCGGVRGILGAGRECRYSGARRGICGIWEFLGDVGSVGAMRGASEVQGVSGMYQGAGRECRYSGARRGIGGIRGNLGIPRWCWDCKRGIRGVSGV